MSKREKMLAARRALDENKIDPAPMLMQPDGQILASRTCPVCLGRDRVIESWRRMFLKCRQCDTEFHKSLIVEVRPPDEPERKVER